MIAIANRKTKEENIRKKYPDALILDITSKSPYKGLRLLSPFYPHGNIPVPGMIGKTATCVEAIWQGLKVFESCGVDCGLFENDAMEGLKRTVRKYGKPLGHQYGDRLLNYQDARMYIYVPVYKYVLDNIASVQNIIARIKEKAEHQDIVFLDYNTNADVFDFSKPLSHASLVKLYIEDKYPTLESYQQWKLSSVVSTEDNRTETRKGEKQLDLFEEDSDSYEFKFILNGYHRNT